MAVKHKKQYKIFERGVIHIVATFNNTVVTVSNEAGDPFVVGSTGMHGFSGTRKSTPHAATVTVDSVLTKAIQNHGLRHVNVVVKGIGPGREACLRAIKASELDVEHIVDKTPVPHNGVRPPKLRRV